MPRENNSLPVPVSPMSSTVVRRVVATRAASAVASRSAALSPMMFWNPKVAPEGDDSGAPTTAVAKPDLGHVGGHNSLTHRARPLRLQVSAGRLSAQSPLDSAHPLPGRNALEAVQSRLPGGPRMLHVPFVEQCKSILIKDFRAQKRVFSYRAQGQGLPERVAGRPRPARKALVGPPKLERRGPAHVVGSLFRHLEGPCDRRIRFFDRVPNQTKLRAVLLENSFRHQVAARSGNPQRPLERRRRILV